MGTWSARVARVRLTPIWQLVIFPAEPVYCRCTPTECLPCLRKPVSSIIQVIHAIVEHLGVPTTGPPIAPARSTSPDEFTGWQDDVPELQQSRR